MLGLDGGVVPTKQNAEFTNSETLVLIDFAKERSNCVN